MRKIETEFGDFFDNEKTGEVAEGVFQNWLNEHCELVDGVWVRKEQIDICPEPTDKERITKLEEEKSILAENVYQLATILEVMLGGTTDGQTETTTTDTTN